MVVERPEKPVKNLVQVIPALIWSYIQQGTDRARINKHLGGWMYMDTHIHEQLCAVEHREKSFLSEVSAGSSEIAVP